MVSWEAVVTLVVIVGMLGAMTREVAPPDMVMMAALILFLPLRIINVEEAVQGFCNTGMLTVAVLFVVATGVERTGAIEPIRNLLTRLTAAPEGQSASLTRILVVVMTPVSLLSAFLNNTPVVAMMIPVLDTLARSMHISPSKLLIPLSYSSILGGTCTLIGTSTNLVVVGLARDAAAADGESFEMGIFEIGQIGLPVLLAGFIYIVVFAGSGLPARLGVTDALDRPREYITVMIVNRRDEGGGSPAGKTVADAGLRALPGLFLVQIERASGDVISAPGPSIILAEDDKLYFAGVVNSVLSLTQIRGLRLAEETEDSVDLYRLKGNDVLVEAVVAPHSVLCHQTVRQLSFRARYGAAIIAVHRHGTRINRRIGDIALEGGDTLLLVANRDFTKLHRNREHFALVSEVSGHQALRRNKAWFAAVVTLAMVVASILGVSLLTAALVAVAALILGRCLTATEARQAINLEVLLVIAAAFGISQALVNSGAADLLADWIVAAARPTGTVGLYICIYVATVLFTACVTNNAAVTIMFPVAREAALQTGLDFRPFLFLIMMAASASFMTPTGYQTNLMVYGPGGYTFMDYVKFGGPLQLWVALVTILVVVTMQFWYLWSAALLLGLVVAALVANARGRHSPPHALSRRESVSTINGGPPRDDTVYFFQPDMGLEVIRDPQEDPSIAV